MSAPDHKLLSLYNNHPTMLRGCYMIMLSTLASPPTLSSVSLADTDSIATDAVLHWTKMRIIQLNSSKRRTTTISNIDFVFVTKRKLKKKQRKSQRNDRK